jgi:pyridoxal phosphate-dependent aminotransferase EpsN
MPVLEGTYSNRWLTALTLNPDVVKITPYELIDVLEADNIEARPVWKPLHMQPLFEDCKFYPHADNGVVSERLFVRAICLPSGSNMTEDEQKIVIKTIKSNLTIQ